MRIHAKPAPADLVRRAVTTGGRPLAAAVRADMERGLGHDFRDVWIHTGPEADTSARAVDAVAYTTGEDIVFRHGHYAPETGPGRRMLAHELVHVIQQRSGPVSGVERDGLRVSEPGDLEELAAEEAASNLQRQDADLAEDEEEPVVSALQCCGEAADCGCDDERR